MTTQFDDLLEPARLAVGALNDILDGELPEGLLAQVEPKLDDLAAKAQNKLSQWGINAQELNAFYKPLAQVETDPSISYDFTTSPAISSAIGFGISGSTQLLIDVVKQNEAQNYPDFAPAEGFQLVVTQFSAKLATQASLAATLQYLQLGLEASAEMQFTGRIFSYADQSERLGHHLLAQSHADLSLSIADPVATRQTLSNPNIAGFSLIHQRGYTLDTQLTVGKSWDLTQEQLSAVQISASAGLKLSASLKFAGKCRVLCKPNPHGMLMSIEQINTHGGSLGLSLEAGLDIVGLDKVANSYLKDSTDYADSKANALRDLLEAYKAPGSWLFGQLSDTLNEQNPADWVTQISAYILGDTDDQALNQWLNNQLQTRALALAANEFSPWQTNAQTFASELTAKLLPSFGIDLTSDSAQRLQSQVESKLADASTQAQQKLKDKIAELSQGISDHKAISQPLKKVKAAMAKLKDNLDQAELIQSLYDAVIEWLSIYQSARAKLDNALAYSAQLQLGLSVYGNVGREEHNTGLLSLLLVKPDTHEGRALYRKMMLGLPLNIEQLKQLQKDGVIAQLGGWLASRLTDRQTVGFKLSFGPGLGIEGSRSFENIIDAKVDAEGRILVADSKITQKVTSKTFKETREACFVCGYDVVAAIQSGSRPSIGLSLSFADDSGMDLEEMHEFLHPLTQIKPTPLVDEHAYLAAEDWYRAQLQEQGAGEYSKAKLLSSRIDCHLSFDDEDLARLLEPETSTAIYHEALEQLCQLDFDAHLRNKVREKQANGLTLEQALLELSQPQPHTNLGAPTYAQKEIAFDNVIWIPISNALTAALELSRLPGHFRTLKQKVELLPPQDNSEELTRIIKKFNAKVNESVEDWLKVRGSLSGLVTEKLPKEMLALLILLAKVLQRPNKPPLLVPVVSKQVGDQLQTRILTPAVSS